MIDAQTIEEVKKRLVKAFNPLEIYIFGSYAWGKPDEESDLDLLIVVEKYKQNHYKDLVLGHKALMDMSLSKDILLFNKEEFEKKSKDVTEFCYKVKRSGKRIYAKA
jgi:uncharacterized protein